MTPKPSIRNHRGAPVGREPVYPCALKIRLYAEMGAALRARREAADLSRADLAKAMQVSVSTLVNYENGTTPPTVHALYLATLALDCTLDDLVPVVAA